MILETASDDKHSKMEYDKFLCPQARASASWFCTSVRQHYCHPMTISVSNNAASSASGARIVSYSSQAPGCGASNVLDQNPGKLWLTSSASNLPQHVVIELAREPGINLKTFGWFCWHAYSTNPARIDLHLSRDGVLWTRWDSIESECRAGIQLHNIQRFRPLENPFVKVEIVRCFGGRQTYLNRLYLHSDGASLMKRALGCPENGEKLPRDGPHLEGKFDTTLDDREDVSVSSLFDSSKLKSVRERLQAIKLDEEISLTTIANNNAGQSIGVEHGKKIAHAEVPTSEAKSSRMRDIAAELEALGPIIRSLGSSKSPQRSRDAASPANFARRCRSPTRAKQCLVDHGKESQPDVEGGQSTVNLVERSSILTLGSAQMGGSFLKKSKAHPTSTSIRAHVVPSSSFKLAHHVDASLTDRARTMQYRAGASEEDRPISGGGYRREISSPKKDENPSTFTKTLDVSPHRVEAGVSSNVDASSRLGVGVMPERRETLSPKTTPSSRYPRSLAWSTALETSKVHVPSAGDRISFSNRLASAVDSELKQAESLGDLTPSLLTLPKDSVSMLGCDMSLEDPEMKRIPPTQIANEDTDGDICSSKFAEMGVHGGTSNALGEAIALLHEKVRERHILAAKLRLQEQSGHDNDGLN